MRKRKRRVQIYIIIVLVALGLLYFLVRDTGQRDSLDFSTSDKKVHIIHDGVVLGAETTRARTVADFLQEQSIDIEGNEVVPSVGSVIYDGTQINLQPKKTVYVSNGGIKTEIRSDMRNIEDLFYENDIELGEDDFVLPSLYASLNDGMKIEVIRVEVEEEIVKKKIDFKTIVQEDHDMGWQEEKVKQKGEKGERERVYRVIYHNDEEIERRLLEERVVKEPEPEIVVKGTYVKLGKKHTGWGTWYAWTGTMAAASPWLPMGSYAKVTNKANGKSVIVVINDRGPFGENRIIDLDKVAFEKIASLGAGIIDVKVEEIEN